MRITTRMLNESARKAGLPVNSTSLLNYINSGDTNNTLLQALNKNKTSVGNTNTVSRRQYERLGKTSDKLTQSIETLLQEGKNSLFTQAKESGDKEKVSASVESLFQNYNSTLSALKNASGTMNNFYRQMLTEAPKEVKKDLESIGITFKKDGTANIDKDKLKEADLDTLENLFGRNSSFMNKMNFTSTRISDNAEANTKSFSSGYTSKGNLYGTSGSRYNFWG